MAVNIDTRSVEADGVAEIYISVTPMKNTSPQKQAEEIFSVIRDSLRSKKAYILQEWIFIVQSAFKMASDVRSMIYGDINDGVNPSFLACSEELAGPIAGVQVHAIVSKTRPEVVKQDGTGCGRIVDAAGLRYIVLSDISAPQAGKQARFMLERAEAVLKQFGTDFLSVPRTWMWLGDILSWYDEFNRVRNQFFTERGILGKGSRQLMPASTGIGLGPADGGECSMDLVAVLEPPNSIQYFQAVGKQQCALEYGSAFSRASRAITPAGETVFVSGTASIDAGGATTNIGDAAGQINASIENVLAVLKDMHCREDDVVYAIAYCKTTEVEKIFNGVKGNLSWPWITVICDVCRPDLLFEIEAAAMPRK